MHQFVRRENHEIGLGGEKFLRIADIRSNTARPRSCRAAGQHIVHPIPHHHRALRMFHAKRVERVEDGFGIWLFSAQRISAHDAAEKAIANRDLQ